MGNMASQPRGHMLHCREPKPTKGPRDHTEYLIGLAIPRVANGELTPKQLACLSAIHTFPVPHPANTGIFGHLDIDAMVEDIAGVGPGFLGPAGGTYKSQMVQKLQSFKSVSCVYSFVGINGNVHTASCGDIPTIPSCITGWDVMHVGVVRGWELSRLAPTCDMASFEVAMNSEPYPWTPLAVALLTASMCVRYADYVKAAVSQLQNSQNLNAIEKKQSEVRATAKVFMELLEVHVQVGKEQMHPGSYTKANNEELGLMGYLDRIDAGNFNRGNVLKEGEEFLFGRLSGPFKWRKWG